VLVPDDSGATPSPEDLAFLAVINGWIELTGALNEVTRSMGEPDFYPFVLSKPAVRKLHFIHKVVKDAGGRLRGGSPTGAGGVAVGDGSSTGAGGGAIGDGSGAAGGDAGGNPVSGGTGTLPPAQTEAAPVID